MKATTHMDSPASSHTYKPQHCQSKLQLALSAANFTPGLGATWSRTTTQVTQRFQTVALNAWSLQLTAYTAVHPQGKDCICHVSPGVHSKAASRTFTVKLSAFSTGGSPGR